MKTISKIVVGVSLVVSSILYANGDHDNGHDKDSVNNHMGDHMHEGKMSNHMNQDGMTNTEMQENMNKNMNQMQKSNMNMNQMGNMNKMDSSNMNMQAYHNTMMINGYNVTFKSLKPLTDGKNHMIIMLTKDGQSVHNADVNIKFSMPSMPGMHFTQHVEEDKKGIYDTTINFSMGGHWAYDLMFKTSDGTMHKANGSMNLK